jgi:hypothetical protein
MKGNMKGGMNHMAVCNAYGGRVLMDGSMELMDELIWLIDGLIGGSIDQWID